jgi:glycolate oxidase iron-sulfur subunit
MQTNFSVEQMADPTTASSEGVIRKCVHCGFCTATCPTYVLLGDELDSPRGRIYLMKEMLENQQTPTPGVVKHIDRCLSCLSCMTTCPSDVNYMHLVDHARAYIQDHYRRPVMDRMFRGLLAAILPYPRRFRIALLLSRLAYPALPLIKHIGALKPLAAMLALAPRQIPAAFAATYSPALTRRGRVALMQGCAEPVLRPEFRAAAVRLLNRVGFDVVFAPREGCCGALVHHMGLDQESLAAARRNVDAWDAIPDLDAIIVTASGCGTTVKDYGFMLRNEPAYAARAARISVLAKDISEFLETAGLPALAPPADLTVAYHSACSLQHGQKITMIPLRLLQAAGFTVKSPRDPHLCCGSAGTYNILQPDIAAQLGDRKAATIEQLNADVIATGNIGCAMQIGARTKTPVVHTVELLDWASGGPVPKSLIDLQHPAIRAGRAA